MKIEKTCRLRGTSKEYWTLAVYTEGKEFPQVHTGKRAHIEKIEKEYRTGIRVACGSYFPSKG